LGSTAFTTQSPGGANTLPCLIKLPKSTFFLLLGGGFYLGPLRKQLKNLLPGTLCSRASPNQAHLRPWAAPTFKNCSKLVPTGTGGDPFSFFTFQ
jgi:hypothetical protein